LLRHHPESALATYRDLAITNRKLQQIVLEKELLEQEIRIAAEIQKSILPDVLPLHERFDLGGLILPARQVGGDFYDAFDLDHHRIGIVIGDVADKGIPSAIFMARVHALIVSQAEVFDSPGHVLHRVNKYIARLDKSAQFVTALYGVLDTETCEFSYARAGHEPPLLVSPRGEIQRLSFKPGMALGLDEHITLDEHSVCVSDGSLLIMFTDGVTDCRNPEGEPFGLERIQTTLATLKDHSAQAACDHLFETLMNYQNGAKQDDDVTLVAVHAK
jgi:sigma-B regulation protein RsbU (phosphoserine phosphatase)